MIAVVLTAAALADLGAFSRHGPGWVALAACVALTGSTAGSRRYPSISVGLAAAGLVTLALSGPHRGSGLPELAVVLWLFYSFARGHHSRGHSAVVLSTWVAASVVVGLCYPDGPLADGSGGVAANVAFWALSGIIAYSLGAAISVYGGRTLHLETAAANLRERQAEHAQRAAEAERAKMARELHDVVAHSVSVIVVQTTGARRIMSTDTATALQALAAVETAGRQALVELRRMVGILRRGDVVSKDLVAPGLAHLRRLIDQARDAGLAVDLAIQGVAPAMSPGLELAIYRVVQEGLTNVIKHAGPTTARVTVVFTAECASVEVSDDGPTSGVTFHNPSGHGLIGLRERVNFYGGTFLAGPGNVGGFRIRASIPLAGDEPTFPVERGMAPRSRPKRSLALDPLLAAGFLVLLEITTLTAHVQGGARYGDVVAVAAMTVALAWRRRQPLWFVIIVVASGLSLSNQVAPQTSVFTALYVSLIPAYTVAAWEARRRAGVGLAILVVAPAIHQMMVHELDLSSYAGFLLVIALAWLAGRAVRSRRMLAATLEHTTTQLVTEQDDRAELAIAGERSRIARELHAAVAQNVAVMVVQAEAARGQLADDPAGADKSLQAIQATGRQVLSEMRRILGVLRYHDEPSQLSPQPGVDQIHQLLDRGRRAGLKIEFIVGGEPGPLSPGVDLAVYRIVEEILTVAAQRTVVAITLQFGEDDVELATDAHPKDRSAWPPASISERVSLCGGQLRISPEGEEGTSRRHLIARLPGGLVAGLP